MKISLLFIALVFVYFDLYAQMVYSRHITPTSGVHFAGSVNTAVCMNCTITNPRNATDTITDNFAVMSKLAAVSGSMRLRMRLNGVGVSIAGVTIENPSELLTAAMLAGVTIRTFRDGALQEWRTGGTSLLTTRVVVGSVPTNRMQVWFPTTQPFDEVEIEIGGLANVLMTTRVYYAFGQVGILPVKLASQQVTQCKDSNQPIIHWRTAFEQDVAYFEIQRTEHIGMLPETVGLVHAINKPSFYSFIDKQAGSGKSYYYRIRIIDKDNSYDLSSWMSSSVENLTSANVSRLGTEIHVRILADRTCNWQMISSDVSGRVVNSVRFEAGGIQTTKIFDLPQRMDCTVLIIKLVCLDNGYTKICKLAISQ